MKVDRPAMSRPRLRAGRAAIAVQGQMSGCSAGVARASVGAQAQDWHAQALARSPCPMTVAQSHDEEQLQSGPQLQNWQVQVVFIGTSKVSGC